MNHRTSMDRGINPRGFSIIELLIAIIIIGILVTILIPVIANRTADARLARANQDVENIANAEDRLAVDTGYLGRLYILNDVPGGDGIPFTIPPNLNDHIDGLRDHGLGGEYYQNSQLLFIYPDTGYIVGSLSTDSAVGTQLYLSVQRNETAFGWHGPYINWQTDDNYLDTATNTVYPDGIPDDPWGNNYLLFTQQGLVKEPDGTVVANQSFPFPNTGGLPTQTYDCKRFDRATILSLGPNGVPGDGSGPGNTNGGQLGQGDDIARKFGQ